MVVASVALVGVVVALAYAWLCVAFRERLALAHKIPGPYVYPVIGNLYLLWHAVRGFDWVFQEAWRRSEHYPRRVAKIMALHRVAVAVWSPEDVEVILSSAQCNEKAKEYRFFQPWLGDGLLISKGDHWRSHRKLIAPTFHVHVLKQFVHLFHRNSEMLCRRLEAVTARTIDIHDYVAEATVDMLLETAMGVRRDTQKNTFEYAMAVVKMCAVLHRRALSPWLWWDFLFGLSGEGRKQRRLLDTIHDQTREVLRVRRAERASGLRDALYKRALAEDADALRADAAARNPEETGISYGQSAGLRDDLDDEYGLKKRVLFLDQMLDAADDDNALTEKEVEEEVTTIMFEGHDTTAAASSFFLCLMGVHRDVQQRCVAELREIFGDSDRPPSFQDTLEMKYLERCIMETLRLFPPVPLIARHVSKNVRLASGYVVPESTTVVIPPFLLHRDPDMFPNAEQFDPDNFLPERCGDRHYYAFIPFSAGPRSCVGRKYAMLKLKILLSTILRKLEVHADVPEKDFKLVGDIILKRKEGFPCRFVPRKRPSRTGMAG
ncbi:cytochrome P450 4g15-like [Thrips palmi]|uniref:Cytochrome P450 4g15-like n=1 Tax=Thrips palmi TaxID=161013 RepID=A0A6P9AEF3_THRPL|nr:cytochrome P450 4g15-like [Thrips palmi]